MDLDAVRGELARNFEDRLLSRNERKAISALLGELDDRERRLVRKEVFALARSLALSSNSSEMLEWLEGVIDVVHRKPDDDDEIPPNEAYFSPGGECLRRIASLFRHVVRSADVCVFTITDDRISDAILEAHGRGVAIRIVTDNEKAEDLGSDINRFERAGIPVRVDRTRFHMHHKYAIFDSKSLLTGSYNWTRGAADSNEENVIVTADARLLTAFAKSFEHLWISLA